VTGYPKSGDFKEGDVGEQASLRFADRRKYDQLGCINVVNE